MKHPYSSLPAHWLPRPLAALGLLLATAGAVQAQTATFALQANLPSTGGILPASVAIADVNGDGRPDALVTNYNSGTLGVLLGNGAGGFTLQTNAPATGAAGSFPASVAIADVNGDGRPDALVANTGRNTLGVLLGNGAGGFTLQPNSPDTGANSTPYSVAIADVNGDGRLDALTANYTSNTLGVLLGNGTGGFTLPPSTGANILPSSLPSTGANSAPYSVAIADVNGDGWPDALTANTNSNTLGVLLGNGAGGFTLSSSPSTGAYSQPYSVAIADINGDGQLDALTANYKNGTLGVLLGNGAGGFTLQANAPATGTGSYSPTSVAIADVNGDGRPDALVANLDIGTLGVLLNTSVIATPTITALSPSTGPVGTQVTITGTNLTGATMVSFNGTPASSLVVNSATSITAVVAAGTTTGLVSVTTPGGTVTSSTSFVVRVPPTTVADSYSTPQNVALLGNVLTNDIGTNPRAILINQPSHGSLVLNPDGSFSYQPAAGYSGLDSFTYYACDPNLPLLCGSPVTVSITVVGGPLTTVADSYSTPQGVTLTGNVLANDMGTNPRAILINRPTHGTLVLNADGSFTYQPTAGYVGQDSFTYYACNMGSPLVCGDPATVSIMVGGVPLTTVADSYSTSQNTTLTGNVLANDMGTNPRAILLNQPTHGALVLNPDGSFTYQPTAGYVGQDSFIYYACNMGSSLVCGDPAMVSITVTPATNSRTAATSTTPAAKPGAEVTGATIRLALQLTGHPNPFTEELRLQFALPIAQAYTLALYDAQGRLVQQLASGQAEAGQVQQVEVPTSAYATGLYLVRLTTATGTQLLKLLKQ